MIPPSVPEGEPAGLPKLRIRVGGPRWLRTAILLAFLVALYAAFATHAMVGVVLLAVAAGLSLEMPDPEDEERRRFAAQARAEHAARRFAVAETALAPEGTVLAGERSGRARSLEGFLAAGTRVEIVNDVDGVWMVRRTSRAEEGNDATPAGS